MVSDGDQGGPPPADPPGAGGAPPGQAGASPGDAAPAAPASDREAAEGAAPADDFAPTPFDETRATEALADRRRLQRRARRAKRKAYVIVRRTGSKAVRLDMERPILSFGRDAAECDIVLEGSGISRRHALIERDAAGYFTLVDCKSRNGTFVDGQPVTTMNLVDGDVFEIGEHRIEFHFREP